MTCNGTSVLIILSLLVLMGRDTILINTSNYVGGNKFVLRLPTPVTFKPGATVTVGAFSMYNSMFNISASQYYNTSVSFQWIDNTVYNWTIPDGYYSVSDLNLWLQSQFVANNLYAVNTKTSQTYYFVQFVTNAPQYKNEIDVFYVPTASDATNNSLSIPANATWTWPTTRKLPILTINTNLLNYFGFFSKVTFGNETVQTKNYQYLSDTTPIISPVFNILLTCNLAHTYMSNSPDLLAQYPISAAYGNLINYISTFDSRLTIGPKVYNEIVVSLWDQSFRALPFKDPELTLTLLIEQ